jgi:hypothetical protein
MPPEGKGIDALPDEVLHHILGFLEAQESVRTCVLSRRWRNLWKSAPDLRILASKGKFLGSVEKLCNFLDCLLDIRGGAPLGTCELRFSYWATATSIVQLIQRLEPLVGNWFRHALVCKAQVLSLYAHDSGRIDGRHGLTVCLYKIPHLNSQHLTRLELGSVVVDNSFLNFSNCPSLQHLKFENCCFGSYGFKLGDSRTHICAPNLVSLHLDETWGWTIPMLESMPSLVKAFVRICMVPGDNCGLMGNCTVTILTVLVMALAVMAVCY